MGRVGLRQTHEIADIESQDTAALGRCLYQLLLIGRV